MSVEIMVDIEGSVFQGVQIQAAQPLEVLE